jgi:CRISPR-associated protein Csm3
MKIINIQSKLKLITGLHIGSSDDSMKIGGVDSPVISREILSDENGNISFNAKYKVMEPYIAGSSIKGKIRSLLEHYFRLVDPTKEGNIIDSSSDFGDVHKRDLIIQLFGESAEKKSTGLQITRAIFRDCFITNEVRKAYINNKIELFEEKAENVIDRNTGTTKQGGLRHIQRVPSAVEFDFDISIRVFENDNVELLEDIIKLGIKLLELDALGGSGSRGYGKVEFSDIKESIEDLAKKVG